MLARAAVILLIVLNLGVAMWWALRPPSPPPAAPEQPQGVPRLQLLAEASPDARGVAAEAARSTPAQEGPLAERDATGDATGDAVAAGEPAPPSLLPEEEEAAPATSAVAEPSRRQCQRLGPFADRAAAVQAQAALPAHLRHSRLREETVAARGWRVLMGPEADREAAQDATARLSAAGFDDHFILGGDDANAIALGRYSSEGAARGHADRLRAAGFPARAEAVGGDARHWLDVAVDDSVQADAARRASGADRARAIDCADMT